MHYILWALDLIYDYLYIFIFTFTPDAMYHSILSTLLCKYIAKKRDTLHAHISTKHEQITFNCHICNLKSKKNGALKKRIEAGYENIRYNCRLQTNANISPRTRAVWKHTYQLNMRIWVQSLWLQSKMEPQCKSSYACSAREYVQKKFKATSYCLKPHNQKDADWMVQTSKQAPEYLGVGWGEGSITFWLWTVWE